MQLIQQLNMQKPPKTIKKQLIQQLIVSENMNYFTNCFKNQHKQLIISLHRQS